jgi:hypothetical protein
MQAASAIVKANVDVKAAFKKAAGFHNKSQLSEFARANNALESGKWLLVAKSGCPHGQFKALAEKAMPCSYRQSRKYMQLAKMAPGAILKDELIALWQRIHDGPDVPDEDEAQSDDIRCNKCNNLRPAPAVKGCNACATIQGERKKSNAAPPMPAPAIQIAAGTSKTDPDEEDDEDDIPTPSANGTSHGSKVHESNGKAHSGNGKPKKADTPPPDAGDAWEPPSDSEKAAEKDAKVPRDGEGYVVPKKLRDTFGDTFLSDSAAALKGIVKHLKNNQTLYPWTNLSLIVPALEEACKHVEFGKPYIVHRDCDGKGCSECRGTGWITKWRKVELENQP